MLTDVLLFTGQREQAADSGEAVGVENTTPASNGQAPVAASNGASKNGINGLGGANGHSSHHRVDAATNTDTVSNGRSKTDAVHIKRTAADAHTEDAHTEDAHTEDAHTEDNADAHRSTELLVSDSKALQYDYGFIIAELVTSLT